MLTNALFVLAFLTRLVSYTAVVIITHEREPGLCLFYGLILLSEVLEIAALLALHLSKKTDAGDGRASGRGE
jgi:hypothetical protein